MASTQLFTLGFGVTVSKPLGQVIDLRQQEVGRLRRQVDGIRLGRFVGEVIRLGLELEKLREIEQQTAQAPQHVKQGRASHLQDETVAIARLRQHYQMLGNVIAGLSRLRPASGSMTVNVFQQWHTMVQHPQRAVVPRNEAPIAESSTLPELGSAPISGPQPMPPPAQASSQPFIRPQPPNVAPPAPAQPREPAARSEAATASATLGRATLAAAGLGAVAYGGYRGGRWLIGRQSPRSQRQARKAVGEQWQDSRVDAVGKITKALVSADDGRQAARGAGAAVGEAAGRLLGTLVPLLGKTGGKRKASKAQRDQLSKLGGYLGEALGDAGGGILHDWVRAEPARVIAAEPSPGASFYAQTAEPGVEQQPPSAPGLGHALAGGLSAVVAGHVVRNRVRKLPRATRRSAANASRQQWQATRIDLLGEVGKALITSDDNEQRARGVGSALGGMAGRMLGAALPRLSKGRWGRKYGSKLGGYVGEAIGDLAGASAVRGFTKDDAQTPRSDATLPAPGQAAELPGMPQPAQPLTNSEPSGVSPMFEMLMPAALTRLAPAGPLLKRIPALAVLNAAGQIAQTASGEGSTAQKMEGYGRAVGGLGGSLASVAAGAALGSVIPGVGTVIGGLVGWAGGALLANGGEAAGGWLGKTLATVLGAGDSPDSQQAEQRPAQPPAAQPLTGPQPVATPPEVTQHFTFTANMPVTFNNSFEDPNTLQQLEAIARRVLDDLMRQARAVQMADQPQP